MTDRRRDAGRVLAHSYADEVYVRPVYTRYSPTLREEALSAIGCAAHMAGIVIGALVIWGLLFALFLGGAS